MMKVLITGIAGFLGSHLAEYLLTKDDIEIYGVTKPGSNAENVRQIKDKLIVYECDIRDADAVENVLKEVGPEKIFHLAAESYVFSSWQRPDRTLTTNILGQLNILESIRKLKINPLLLIAGSSEEYGLVSQDELPVKETNLLRPLSPYAVSKVGQDLLGYQYHRSYGLNIIRTRAFNQTGPRRKEVFVCSNFAKQIAMIERKKQPPIIYVGNLKARRDFSDVRDIARAYWLALEKCRPGEVYNICSGKAREIKEILDILLSFSRCKIQVKQDPQKLRVSDIPVMQGDSSRFRETTGWQPEIPFEKTLEDLLNYWREMLDEDSICR